MTAPKIWKNEGTVGETCLVGQQRYWIPFTNGTSVDLNAALVDSGQGNTSLQGNSNEASTFYLRNLFTKATIKNLSEHDIYVTVYYCVLREHMEDDVEVGVKNTALRYLAEGWSNRMLDTDESLIGLSVDGDAVTSDMFSLTPYQSTIFCEHFRIMYKRSRKLRSADSMKVSVGKRNLNWRFSKNKVDQAKEDGIGRMTMFPLIKFHGSLGHLATDTDAVAPMSLTLGCQYLKEISFSWIAAHAPLIAVTNSKATSGDYVAPTDQMEADDDP